MQTASSAGLTFHDPTPSMGDPPWIGIGYSGLNTTVHWEAGTTNTTVCIAAGSCNGHLAIGVNQIEVWSQEDSKSGINQYVANSDQMGLMTAALPFSTTGAIGSLLNTAPPNGSMQSMSTDSHPSWQNDNAADTEPALWCRMQDSTLPSGYSNITAVLATYDHECDFVSPAGSNGGVVWRVAHSGGTSSMNLLASPAGGGGSISQYQDTILPQLSPDGRYLFFATSDNDLLGTDPGQNGSPFGYCYQSCQWQASYDYSSTQDKIIDPNGNVEVVSTTGTSGSTEPAWPTAAGTVTDDGTAAWKMYPGCSTAATTSSAGVCRMDIFAVELR
jgi:hypothetical protein